MSGYVKLLSPLLSFFFWGALGDYANSESSNSPNPDLKKKHHLADGTFRNNDIGPISKPFLELLKWHWNRAALNYF